MDELILGISFSHNSSAAVVNYANDIIFASSQERCYSPELSFNYLKNGKFFPVGVIRAALESGILPEQIKTVTWSNYEDPDIYNFVQRTLSPKLVKLLRNHPPTDPILELVSDINAEKLHHIRASYTLEQQQEMINTLIQAILQKLFSIHAETLLRVDHHLCHGYGALKTSGFSDGAIVVTLDGFGDGVSGRVYRVENNRLRILQKNTIHTIGSPCLMYQYATGYMRLEGKHRLKMLQDEYKILALEPHATKDFSSFFAGMIHNDISEERNTIKWSVPDLPSRESLEKSLLPVKEMEALTRIQQYFDQELEQAYIEGYSEFDISRAVQKRFEEVVLTWIEKAIEPYGPVEVALGGGGFYNVKLNFRVKQLPNVKKLWVFPAAGDEGNAPGSAYTYIAENKQTKPKKLANLYLGKRYSNESILEAVRYIEDRFQVRLHYEQIDKETDRVDLIADLLSKRNIVNLANTAIGVEFGPRALMVRSTLASAVDYRITAEISKLFNRYKYMPLAPVIKMENAPKILIGFDPERDTDLSKYMIVAYPCTTEFATQYPAVTHPYPADDIETFGAQYSARPQLVTKEDNPFAWAVLDQYEQRTNEIALINTSLNSHKSPILGDPLHVLIDWLSMGFTSYLVMGDFYFPYKENNYVSRKISLAWKKAKILRESMYARSKKRCL